MRMSIAVSALISQPSVFDTTSKCPLRVTHRELHPAVQPAPQRDLVRHHPAVGRLDSIRDARPRLRRASCRAPPRRPGRPSTATTPSSHASRCSGCSRRNWVAAARPLAMTIENERHHPTLEVGRELEVLKKSAHVGALLEVPGAHVGVDRRSAKSSHREAVSSPPARYSIRYLRFIGWGDQPRNTIQSDLRIARSTSLSMPCSLDSTILQSPSPKRSPAQSCRRSCDCRYCRPRSRRSCGIESARVGAKIREALHSRLCHIARKRPTCI